MVHTLSGSRDGAPCEQFRSGPGAPRRSPAPAARTADARTLHGSGEGGRDVCIGVSEATATTVALTSIPCCCFPPGATTRFSYLRGRAFPACGSAAVRGLLAFGAGGPAAGVRPGEGAGLRRPAATVAQHPLRRAAALPRLPAATGRRNPEGEPRLVRREQGPGADGCVEKLHEFGIGGFVLGGFFFFPSPNFAEYLLSAVQSSNEVILRVI
ncbi:uncharacterized protein LOC133225566 isoform X1 [Neopsephotus bourkii]|uniref:uncharacterized protein LOC133225566 isoform X1 n=1 Tax=Neopsephotus bourkii TaxID=309878 RepID=UPI002AA53A18|nr:uncharacterized protein LOC133225566 isoform X1 [Neopsephotus bourkii]